ncbi:MAG: hypothetical protein OXH51_04190 [Gemmatimonadetes bacterium]|nr:hypothetical protein [Gemmatimonadota bacterium]MCY3610714.1 hypothetical protein [Gemmatimonadota bacterium]MCY3677787.1 hypothetical protein [Gemmatimonadota bacterium]MYA42171.1 hypothetical protein [Gemmatimonadota bacterium]MYE92447.1 hypothetical protein [Gemmatimonadota bacterium]
MNANLSNEVSHEELMRFLDGEVTPEERARIEGRLAGSSELQREFAIFRSMKQDLQDLSFAAPVDDSVWDRIRNRITQPVGWLLALAGFIAWLGYGVWTFVWSPSAIVVKLATGAIVIGILVLLANVIWDRYREYGTDPYRHVQR